ncbi:hypothetical protein A3K87_20730 [Variovorax paradoxus]|uniref:Uncharacterized protein n=1 Tax=Variovorax paradoxus TaxID=34073 RepID=A0AA91DMV7_VARPD|nr:hypothetical protein [Variovorax paradoxus]OAK61365.1 hypothetical protein A3K87_20730 [Variovorax paradoxus]
MNVARKFSALLLGVAAAFCPYASGHAATPAGAGFFDCGGELESRVWTLWDSHGVLLADDLLSERLRQQGDTYALYDFEIYFHNLLSMARRCGRLQRQRAIAALTAQAYAQRSAIGPLASSPGWVCRGGRVCNRRNGLVGTEVMLPSVQFIAFAMNAASDLAQPGASAADMAFIAQTTRIALEHLRRWDDERSRLLLEQRIAARAADVKDGSSRLFLGDKDVWQIAIHAEVAGVLSRYPMLLGKRLDDDDMAALRSRMVLLLRLFKRRTFSTGVEPGYSGSEETGAELDRGFWRLFPDNRYAGYEGAAAPVLCLPAQGATNARGRLEVRMQPPEPVRELGWDISHARRLVALFDALQRNEASVASFHGLPAGLLPSEKVFRAFARQLRARVWNQDAVHPLFSNYFGGTNGWYRVAYDNGANGCTEGIRPSGLSGAFATGGYPLWGRWEPVLNDLARRIYTLSDSQEGSDATLMAQAYPLLTNRASDEVRARSELMFWPALVAAKP